MDDWYYERAGATFGPMTASQLLALRERGSLSDETRLRHGLTGPWIPFHEAALHEMRTALPPPGPPPLAGERPAASSRSRTTRGVPDGPSGWFWFFAVTAVMLTALHSVILAVNGLSFALSMLPSLDLPEVAASLLNFCSGALVISSILYFASVIIWTGTAFASLTRLYGENHVPHGGGAGFWWIVPFANLVMPFRCLRVMRHLSSGLREPARMQPAPSLSVLGIQVSFIATTICRVLDKVSSPSSPVFGSGPASAHPIIPMMLDLTLAAFAFQLAIFILINLIQQVRLFREAQLEE
jgi:hypothetical protein